MAEFAIHKVQGVFNSWIYIKWTLRKPPEKVRHSSSFGFPDGSPPRGPKSTATFPFDSDKSNGDHLRGFMVALVELSQGNSEIAFESLEVAKRAGIQVETEKNKSYVERLVKFMATLGWITSPSTETVSITATGQKVARALDEFYSGMAVPGSNNAGPSDADLELVLLYIEKHPRSDSYDIGKGTGLNRTKVYNAISILLSRGMLEIHESTPQRYSLKVTDDRRGLPHSP